MKYPYGNSIFITGASSGIGLAAAEAFAQAGYQVFAAARSCEDGARGNVTGIRMDVTDEASVVRAKEIVAAQGGVGIILNCAGRGIVGAAEDALDENVRYLFEVNYFGVLRVNRLFMPMLRERGCGLVLIVSSVAGQIARALPCSLLRNKICPGLLCGGIAHGSPAVRRPRVAHPAGRDKNEYQSIQAHCHTAGIALCARLRHGGTSFQQSGANRKRAGKRGAGNAETRAKAESAGAGHHRSAL